MDIDGDGGRRDLRMKDRRISFDGFRSVGRVPLMSCQGMVFSWCIHCERSVKATGRLSIWLRGLRQWLPGLYVSTQAQVERHYSCSCQSSSLWSRFFRFSNSALTAVLPESIPMVSPTVTGLARQSKSTPLPSALRV